MLQLILKSLYMLWNSPSIYFSKKLELIVHIKSFLNNFILSIILIQYKIALKSHYIHHSFFLHFFISYYYVDLKCVFFKCLTGNYRLIYSHRSISFFSLSFNRTLPGLCYDVKFFTVFVLFLYRLNVNELWSSNSFVKYPAILKKKKWFCKRKYNIH